MKKTKLAVVFAALVSMLGFTSCLDDNGSSTQMGQEIVRVSGMPGFYTFRSAGGYTLNPTNQSSLSSFTLDSPFAILTYYYEISDVTQGITELDVEVAGVSPVKSGPVVTGEVPDGGGNAPVYAVLNDQNGVPLFYDKNTLFLPIEYYYAYSSDETELASELNSHSFTLYYEAAESVEGRMHMELCHNVTDSTVTRMQRGTDYRYFDVSSALNSYVSQFGSSPEEILVEFEQNTTGGADGSMNSIVFKNMTSE